MKKLVCPVIVLLLLITWTSVCFADEILFRDIPWGSNITATLDAIGLRDRDFFTDEMYRDLSKDEKYFIFRSHNSVHGFGWLYYDNTLAGDYGYRYTSVMSPYVYKANVAGYEMMITLEFLYGFSNDIVTTSKAHANFFRAEYKLSCKPHEIASTFDDLMGKLTWLYGDPTINDRQEHKGWANDIAHDVIWEGDNHTAVHLSAFWSTSATEDTKGLKDITIEYGLTNVSERMNIIKKHFEREELNNEYNEENTDGL